MKRTVMKAAAAAVFAMGLTLGLGGTASAQVGGSYCSPNGATTNIVQNGMRYYYRCENHKWVLTRACPISGGPCLEP